MEVETPAGRMRMWFTGEHLEVAEPATRLHRVDGRRGRQPGRAPGHPSTTEVHVELTALDGGTRLVLTHVGVPAGSPGAAGWSMALDKLAARLATPAAS